MTIPHKDRFNHLTPDEVENNYLFEEGEHVIKYEPFTFKEKLQVFTLSTVMVACISILFAIFKGNWKTVNDFGGLFIAYWSYLFMDYAFEKSAKTGIFIKMIGYLSLTIISGLIMGLAILHQLKQIELFFK